MVSLFASASDAETPFLHKEGQFIAQLNMQAYHWLGPRYRYFNKIRNASKGGLDLFGDRNLEELMEATRSALSIVTKTLNAGLVSAHNNVIDAVANVGAEPEGWPAKIEMPDRNNPPNVSVAQDALIVGWMPLKFLNLAKAVRDKGKGLDIYAEGLAKKLYFKVVGYYGDPGHWNADRLAFMLGELPPDAPVLDVTNRLSGLKADLDLFASSYQLFKFGRAPRTGTDASTKNTLEDALEVSQEELVRDLYFQHFIIAGLEQFLFRYYLTLLGATSNPRALRALTTMFEPALAKCVENRLQFQASFLTEKEKIRLRTEFQSFAHDLEARPVVEEVEEKGHPVRQINYTTRLLDLTAYARAPRLSERHAQTWAAYLRAHVIERAGGGPAQPLLLEILNTLVRTAKLEIDGKLKVAQSLRAFALEREKQEQRQVALMKKKVAEAKRKKMTSARKFKVLEQTDMAKTVEEEAVALEQKGLQDVETMEQAIAKRKEALLARAAQYEETGQDNVWQAAARSAGAVYQIATSLDTEGHFQNEFVTWLLGQIREGADGSAQELYKHLFDVMPGLHPAQKIILRKALESKLELAPDELVVSEEEQRAYREQIVTRKTELNMAAPGVFDLRLDHGALRATMEQLLAAGITNPSLRLLMQIPMNPPGKSAAKLPPPLVQKLLQLNALINPFPELDLILPNVEETAPPAKRLNFNRLAKALGGAA
jgi:hypothetical protein